METKDPALTKTPISSHETAAQIQTNTTAHTDTNAIIDTDHEKKGTQTLQETLIDSDFIHDMEHLDDDPVDVSVANRSTNEHIAGESVTHEEPLRKVVVDEELAERDALDQGRVTSHNRDQLAADTSVTNHTDTFKGNVVDSKHVNDGDNPARHPDRRDQEGSPFDEGVNEHTVDSEDPQSHEINDMNRYANIDNAQTRILNPDEKD